jgi:Ca-activated chloride channel family protein
MSFAAPWALLAALAAVLTVVLPLLWHRQVGATDSLPAALHAFVAGGRVGIGRALPGRPWRFGLAMLLLALAIGRPQWGAAPDADRGRHRVVIALDLSKSMVATDALPSRIAQARAIAERFVEQSPTADIGLIGFSGRAFLLAPPSADRALLGTFLPAVHPDQMLVPGSNLAALLTVALDSFGADRVPRTLVLLSDGEAEPTPWRPLLPRLAARGIRVISVGVGTPTGSLVDASGAAVRSRLDAGTLREIAAATGGSYLGATDADDLAARVDALGRQATPLAAGPDGAAKIDRFGKFLLVALLLLAWSALVEWPTLPVRRTVRPAGWLSVAALSLLVTSTAGEAIKPPAEPDPLRDVKRVVAEMVATTQPTAADYMALAMAVATYGEAHRLHPHPLRIGAVQDGLAAIVVGVALEPTRPGWATLRARLQRLLRPPRSADDPEEGDGAPDGEASASDDAPDEDEIGFDPNGQPWDARQVGGTQRSPGEQAEWQVPSLVKPAFILEKLRTTDKPGTLFRILQRQEPGPPGKGGQTW